jgi:hypothetical protein
MLCALLTIESSLARHIQEFTVGEGLNWAFARKAALSKVRDCEIFSLGSSTSKFGVVSSVMEDLTGHRTFNLAMCSSDMAGNYFTLRRAIEAGARPKAVLIDCYISQDITSDTKRRYLNIRSWPEFLGLREAADIAWSSRDVNFLTTVALSWFCPSYKARFEVRNNVLAAVRGEVDNTAECSRFYRRNWGVNRGSQVMQRNPEFEARHVGEVAKLHVRTESPDLDMRGIPAGPYARRFLDLAASNNIRVFYLMLPLTPLKLDERVQCGEDLKDVKRARYLQSLNRDLVVIDGRNAHYPPQAFWDDVHMNGEGARVFTAEAASIVNQYLSGTAPRDRWVALHEYAAPTPRSEHSVELLADSINVVRSNVRR